MSEEYFIQEEADIALADINNILNIERQEVNQTHRVDEALMALDLSIAHLDERLPENAKKLHDLNAKLVDLLNEITHELNKGEHRDLTVVKETSHRASFLEEGIRARDWRVVRKVKDSESEAEDNHINIEKEELRIIHKKFLEIMKVMKRSELIKAINDDDLGHSDAERFVNMEEYYFTQVYNLLRTYERVFRDLWEKERILLKKMKK